MRSRGRASDRILKVHRACSRNFWNLQHLDIRRGNESPPTVDFAGPPAVVSSSTLPQGEDNRQITHQSSEVRSTTSMRTPSCNSRSPGS